jgi:hypothetical protein
VGHSGLFSLFQESAPAWAHILKAVQGCFISHGMPGPLAIELESQSMPDILSGCCGAEEDPDGCGLPSRQWKFTRDGGLAVSGMPVVNWRQRGTCLVWKGWEEHHVKRDLVWEPRSVFSILIPLLHHHLLTRTRQQTSSSIPSFQNSFGMRALRSMRWRARWRVSWPLPDLISFVADTKLGVALFGFLRSLFVHRAPHVLTLCWVIFAGPAIWLFGVQSRLSRVVCAMQSSNRLLHCQDHGTNQNWAVSYMHRPNITWISIFATACTQKQVDSQHCPRWRQASRQKSGIQSCGVLWHKLRKSGAMLL